MSPHNFRCYGSGDGSLSFVWLDDSCTVASGRPVTKVDVDRYLATEEGQRKVQDGWKYHLLKGNHLLAKQVKRVNSDTLQVVMDGEVHEYIYEIESNSPYYRRHHELIDGIVTIKWYCDVLGQWMRLNNLGIRSILVFFLNHEHSLQDNLLIPRLVAFGEDGKAIAAGNSAQSAIAQGKAVRSRVMNLPGSVDFITMEVIGKTADEILAITGE